MSIGWKFNHNYVVVRCTLDYQQKRWCKSLQCDDRWIVPTGCVCSLCNLSVSTSGLLEYEASHHFPGG